MSWRIRELSSYRV